MNLSVHKLVHSHQTKNVCAHEIIFYSLGGLPYLHREIVPFLLSPLHHIWSIVNELLMPSYLILRPCLCFMLVM